MRQRDIVDQEKLDGSLTIVGAGAVGSFTALTLAKMGYAGDMYVYDGDIVEAHNLPNQFHPTNSIGLSKVKALCQTVLQFSDKEIDGTPVKIDELGHSYGVMFALDSMDGRILLYNTIKKETQWLFDARMGAELMRIYTINLKDKKDIALYEKTLYPSAKAKQLPCTAKSVIYNVAVIAGLLTNQVKKAMMGEDYKREIIFDLKTLQLLTN